MEKENKFWLIKFNGSTFKSIQEDIIYMSKVLDFYIDVDTFDFINKRYFLNRNEYDGIYLSVRKIQNNENSWGYMPYPNYKIYGVEYSSKEYFLERNYKYMGELYRKLKLEKLNKIYNG